MNGVCKEKPRGRSERYMNGEGNKETEDSDKVKVKN